MSSRNYCVAFALLLVSSFLQAQKAPAWQSKHIGKVHDWTSTHVFASGGLTEDNVRLARTEPRVLMQLGARNVLGDRAVDGFTLPEPRLPIQRPGTVIIDGGGSNGRRGIRIDWAVSLGSGYVPAGNFPAKYGFDVGGMPDCTNDYVVFGLNVAGKNKGQPNMVGVNNLYSGTNGFCGQNPNVYWAYNGSTVGGSVITSPVLSIDGTKIAYVESGTNSAVFHILAWVSGDGTINRAVTPSSPTHCVTGGNCLQSVTLSSTSTTTFSSPWVDYQTDKGFVGTDDGKIYRISCVFTCTANTNPTIDWTYTLPVAGTGGASATPNGPVYNFPYGYLIVGDQLGELWVINAGGSSPSLHAGPLMIGGGGCTVTNPPGRTGTPSPCTANGTAYGMPDSVLVDASGSSEMIFAFSGNNGTNAVVAQATQDLTGLVSVPVGQGGIDIHTGTFDNTYFNTPASGHLFMCGTGATDTTPYHYWIGFNSYPVINSTPTGSLQRIGSAGVECVPYTEFYNPNLNLGGVSGHHDLLLSGLIGGGNNGYIISNDISTGSVPGALNVVNYPGGVSGIVVDNNSIQTQASSVYFTTQGTVNVGGCNGNICAVKLTQGSLQ